MADLRNDLIWLCQIELSISYTSFLTLYMYLENKTLERRKKYWSYGFDNRNNELYKYYLTPMKTVLSKNLPADD